MSGLPPTAQRLLKAARYLLETEGPRALTFSRIADTAGEHKQSITYHFGNKAGLMTALADYLSHYTAEGLAQLDDMPAGARRVKAAVRTHSRIAADGAGQLPFFEILMASARDPEMRRRMASAYERYRGTHLIEFAPGADEAEAKRLWPVTALAVAVIDGIALQMMLAGDDYDYEAVFRYWERILVGLSEHDWEP